MSKLIGIGTCALVAIVLAGCKPPPDRGGIIVEHSFRDGIRLKFSQENGVRVDDTGKNGLLINNPGLHGIHVKKAGKDGLRIENAGGKTKLKMENEGSNYSYAPEDDASGITIESTTGNGMVISDSLHSGLVVAGFKQPGIVVVGPEITNANPSPRRTGIFVTDVERGIYFQNATTAIGMHEPFVGMQIQEALRNGIQIGNARRDGIQVKGTRYAVNAVGPVFSTKDIQVQGTKSSIVGTPNGNKTLYSIDSPENWFEDFGTAELISDFVEVKIRTDFLAVIDETDYRVFLTPLDDCNGLYVQRKGPSSFVVRELNTKGSSLPFDYRIVGKRKGYKDPELRLKEFDIPEPDFEPYGG